MFEQRLVHVTESMLKHKSMDY